MEKTSATKQTHGISAYIIHHFNCTPSSASVLQYLMLEKAHQNPKASRRFTLGGVGHEQEPVLLKSQCNMKMFFFL